MGILPRMILILKWDPQSVRPIIQMIQTQSSFLMDAIALVTEYKRLQVGKKSTGRACFVNLQKMFDTFKQNNTAEYARKVRRKIRPEETHS